MPRLRWLTLIVVAFAAHAAAEIYRWTDAEGKVHYSDAPPASGKGKAEQVKLPPVSSIRGPATVSNAAPGVQSPRRQPVILYTAAWCGYCQRAKAHLRQRGIGFDERDVETSVSGRREYQQLGGRGVPIILVGTQRMDGFDAGGLDAMLKSGGYP
ncbi:MAG: glutaredoxin family protein [Betaproteobacteria bacterium]|nr:glutaredoxin family protein [Betaproteobacteria bacterium]